jgi:DNA polymerase-1
MSQTFIIDASSFQYRAFHASKNRPTYTKDGLPNAAVLLFKKMLRRLLAEHSPDYTIAAADTCEQTFRTKLYAFYKATRLTPPEDYIRQLPGFDEALRNEHIPVFAVPGYEADDVIGTLCQAIRKVADVVIVSDDKDVAQLVSVSHDEGEVRLLNDSKNQMLNIADVKERYGVWPHQMVDYLALVGDSVDNVPGADGIGCVGAAMLINQFGSVEHIIHHASEIAAGRLRHAVLCYADSIRLSKKLVTIDCNVPLPVMNLMVAIRQSMKDPKAGGVSLKLPEVCAP